VDQTISDIIQMGERNYTIIDAIGKLGVSKGEKLRGLEECEKALQLFNKLETKRGLLKKRYST
jgi:hypothetical protein